MQSDQSGLLILLIHTRIQKTAGPMNTRRNTPMDSDTFIRLRERARTTPPAVRP